MKFQVLKNPSAALRPDSYDISERKLAEETIRKSEQAKSESEERFREMADCFPRRFMKPINTASLPL
jgi:hypothetical protein